MRLRARPSYHYWYVHQMTRISTRAWYFRTMRSARAGKKRLGGQSVTVARDQTYRPFLQP